MQVETTNLDSGLENQATEKNQAGKTEHTNWFMKWGSLIVMSLALSIIIIDTTVLNVALATIIQDLKTTIQNIQWVITLYALILTAFTITGGRLGDLFGKKKMFVTGAIVFAAGSFIASISHHVSTLIIGEAVIEGIGAALMMPATASLLVSNFKGRERALAFGVWGGIAAASAAIGPILGGYLTTTYSWRWAFRINIFVAAALVLGSIIVREGYRSDEKADLDWVGVILSSLGLLSVVFGFIKATDYGWFKAKEQFTLFSHTLNLGHLSVTPLFVLLGIIIIGLFLLFEEKLEDRGHTPLVSLELFKNRQFTSSVIVVAVMTLGQAGSVFALPVFFEAVRKLDAFHTGIALVPLSLTLLIGAPLSAYLSKFIKPKYLIQAGLLLAALGLFITEQMLHVDSGPRQTILGLSVYGFGMGLAMAQISNMALSAVSLKQAGEAAGVNNTFRQLGSTIGAAVIGSILLTSLSTNLSTRVLQSNVIPENQKQSYANIVSSQTSNIEFGGGAVVPGILNQKLQNAITIIGKEATTDANRTALLFTALFTFLGFVVSFALPSLSNLETEKDASHHSTKVQALSSEPEPSYIPVRDPQPIAFASVESEAIKATPPPGSTSENVVTNQSTLKVKTEKEIIVKNRLALAPILLGVVIAGAAAGWGGYEIGKKKNTTTVLNVPASPNTSPNQETLVRPDGDINLVNSDSSTGHPTPTPGPEVLGMTTTPPASPERNTVTQVSNTVRIYTHKQLGITFNTPVWAMTQNFSNGYDVTFSDSNGNVVAALHADLNISEGLSEIQSTLVSDPTVSNIRQITIAGVSALKYHSNRTAEDIIVLVYRNNVVFLHGDLVNNASIRFF